MSTHKYKNTHKYTLCCVVLMGNVAGYNTDLLECIVIFFPVGISCVEALNTQIVQLNLACVEVILSLFFHNKKQCEKKSFVFSHFDTACGMSNYWAYFMI